MRSSAWIASLLIAGLTACGSSGDDRFELRTPGTEDSQLRIREIDGSAPERRGKPTRAEVAVIRGWADALRAGHVVEASRFFAVPTEVYDGTNPRRFLADRAAVLAFNRGLPCGARLIAAKRGEGSLIIATFRLTERPGPGTCGAGVGEPVATEFRIRGHRIARWWRLPDPAGEPQPEGDVS